MADGRDQRRWDPTNGGHEPQHNMVPGLYANEHYSTTSSSQGEIPMPSHQQRLGSQAPEERTQPRTSGASGPNKLKKKPPRQRSLPPPSSNPESPLIFTHTAQVPIPLVVQRDTRTHPENAQDMYNYVSSTPQAPPQRSRHNSQAPAQLQNIPPIPLSFQQRPHGSYPIVGQSQAHRIPSTPDSHRGRPKPIRPIASSTIGSSRLNGEQGGGISAANNYSRPSTNLEYTLSTPSSFSGTSMTASNQPYVVGNANHSVHENDSEHISRQRRLNGIANRPPPPNRRLLQPETANWRELLEWPVIVPPGEPSRTPSQDNVPDAHESRVDAAGALLPDSASVPLAEGNYSQGYYYSESHNFLNRAGTKLRVKKAFHWANPDFFHRYAIFSWTSPYSYQIPGRFYKTDAMSQSSSKGDSVAEIQRMYTDFDEDEKDEIKQDLYAEKRATRGQIKYLDVFRRKTRGRVEDRYVDPTDGRLGVLVIQASSSIYNSRNKTTWRRTYIENVSPYFVRLAYWPMSGIHQNPDEWGRDRWIYVGLRWLPSCIGILISMFGPTDAGGEVRNNGFYDPFSYRFWSYPKIARNVYENRPPGVDLSRIEDRIIRPRKLCFLDATSEENPNGLLAEEAWGGRNPTYIFISYTGQGQFGRRCKTKGGCRCNQCLIAFADAEALHRIARVAASNAGVPAYWTDQCCMSTDPEEFSKDIYRISDVVRNAYSLAIVLGESGGGKTKQIPELLVEWGTRLWTFPEALLAPSKKDILIYRRGYDNSPIALSRLELSHQTWAKDQFRLRVRELIDHYDNTLTLSRLELVVIVLECLLSRETTIFSEGDLAYALMGLLRQRPTTDKSDSAFQAFARLSLANDSDRLLERMICLLPKDQLKFNSRNRHYWATLDDFWDAKLWDIEPICQIAAIGMDDTVVLDGAHAATIHWNSFHRVAITTKETWTRMICRTLLRLTPGYLLSGIISLLTRSTPAAIIFMILAVVFTLISPLLILHVYSGKVWSTQPWLFGFEGHLPIKEIEKKIFGFPQNRLTWAPYASTFSRHRPHESFLKDECRGIDPTRDAAVKSLVDRGPSAEYGEPRVFTLVDTNTMTVTLFAAERPPVVALLCGSEGGMQRAIMCSYDWPTQTLYRETVLRMETRVLEKMPRVGRVSFGLRRNVQGEPETWPINSLETTDLADGPMWV